MSWDGRMAGKGDQQNFLCSIWAETLIMKDRELREKFEGRCSRERDNIKIKKQRSNEIESWLFRKTK